MHHHSPWALDFLASSSARVHFSPSLLVGKDIAAAKYCWRVITLEEGRDGVRMAAVVAAVVVRTQMASRFMWGDFSLNQVGSLPRDKA